eukprot:m.139750 g.139750  ORF g.139750 m.139750 type:complete len:1721 (+) comp17067_c0_seq4:162-5324(+)
MSKKQRVKGNAQASSSSRAAAALTSSDGQVGFIGFGTQRAALAGLAAQQSAESSSSRQLGYLATSTVAASADGTDAMTPNLRMHLTKLKKKDATTRTRSLNEIEKELANCDKDAVQAMLLHWPRLYARLGLAVERRVREGAQRVHMKLTQRAGKDLAPSLKSLITWWMLCQFDPSSRECASLATQSFDAVFPGEKRAKTLTFCKAELMQSIKDNVLMHTEKTVSDLAGASTDTVELEGQYERIVSGSCCALAQMLRLLSAEANETLRPDLVEIVSSARFWKLGKHKSPAIRGAVYDLTAALATHGPSDLLDASPKKPSVLMLGSFGEEDLTALTKLLHAAPLFAAAFPACWQAVSFRKLCMPCLLPMLQAAGRGATQVYTTLVPLLAATPPELLWEDGAPAAPVLQVVQALWQGRERIRFDKDAQQLLLTCYFDTVVTLLPSTSDVGARTALLEHVVSVVLAASRAEQTARGLGSVVVVLDAMADGLSAGEEAPWQQLAQPLKEAAVAPPSASSSATDAAAADLLDPPTQAAASPLRRGVRFDDGDGDQGSGGKLGRGPSSNNEPSAVAVCRVLGAALDMVPSSVRHLVAALASDVFNALLHSLASGTASPLVCEPLAGLVTTFGARLFDGASTTASDTLTNSVLPVLEKLTAPDCDCADAIASGIALAVQLALVSSEADAAARQQTLQSIRALCASNYHLTASFIKAAAAPLQSADTSFDACGLTFVDDAETAAEALRTSPSAADLLRVLVTECEGGPLLPPSAREKIVGTCQAALKDFAASFAAESVSVDDSTVALAAVRTLRAWLATVLGDRLPASPSELVMVPGILAALFQLYHQDRRACVAAAAEVRTDVLECSKQAVQEALCQVHGRETLQAAVGEPFQHAVADTLCKQRDALLADETSAVSAVAWAAQLADLLATTCHTADAKHQLLDGVLPKDTVAGDTTPATGLDPAFQVASTGAAPASPSWAQQQERLVVFGYQVIKACGSDLVAAGGSAAASAPRAWTFVADVVLAAHETSATTVSTTALQAIAALIEAAAPNSEFVTCVCERLKTVALSAVDTVVSRRRAKAFGFWLSNAPGSAADSLASLSLTVGDNGHLLSTAMVNVMTTLLPLCPSPINTSPARSVLQYLSEVGDPLRNNQAAACLACLLTACRASPPSTTAAVLKSLLQVFSAWRERDADVVHTAVNDGGEDTVDNADEETLLARLVLSCEIAALFAECVNVLSYESLSAGVWDVVLCCTLEWLEFAAGAVGDGVVVQPQLGLCNLLLRRCALLLQAVGNTMATVGIIVRDGLGDLPAHVPQVRQEWREFFAVAASEQFMPVLITKCSQQPSEEALCDLAGNVAWVADDVLRLPGSFSRILPLLDTPFAPAIKASHALLKRVIALTKQDQPEDQQADEDGDSSSTDTSPAAGFLETLFSLIESTEVSEHGTGLLRHLVTWLLFFEAFQASSAQARAALAERLKPTGAVAHLLCLLFEHITPDLAPAAITDGLSAEFDACSLPGSGEGIASLCVHVYLQCLRTLPAMVRAWWENDCGRQLANEIGQFTSKYVSNMLIEQEFASIRHNTKEDEHLSIKLRPSSREVVAGYQYDQMTMELIVTLAPNHPLKNVEVDCGQKTGVQQAQRRQWMLQMMTFLRYQNGSILDAILLWKRNVDKRFEGLEECTICYSILHGSNYQLPSQRCKTCKNLFHSACLFKWFSTSQQSTCPLCRNLF